ncbi:MAG: FxLYD domain-containing protein, partial [Nitrososphaera sp.]
MHLKALLPLVLIIILTLGSVQPMYSGKSYDMGAFASTANTNESAISVESISTRYDSEFESFHIFGEAVNNLEAPVQNVRLNVTFYDSQGNLTGTIISSPYFSNLAPGEKSAFDIVAQGQAASDLLDFSYYKISRTWETATEQKQDLLRLDIREISLDPCGFYRIGGTVTNLANNHTSGISVSAAFYNEQNQVVATAFTTIKERLDPTKLDEFTLVIEKEALPHFAYYSLNAQSDQYTTASFEGEEDLSNFHSLTPIGGKIMTVATNKTTYEIKEDKILVSGLVPPEEVRKREDNSLLLIKVLTGSGSIQVLVTTPVPEDGIFSREVEFQMDENMKGEVFRVRAEYFGMQAESTFSIGHASDNPDQPSCKEVQKVAIAELKAQLDGDSGGNITDFLSGREIKLGSNVTLSASLDNEVSRAQNVTVIFEVFDSRGVVVYIHVAEYELSPNTQQDLQVSWHPQD